MPFTGDLCRGVVVDEVTPDATTAPGCPDPSVSSPPFGIQSGRRLKVRGTGRVRGRCGNGPPVNGDWPRPPHPEPLEIVRRLQRTKPVQVDVVGIRSPRRPCVELPWPRQVEVMPPVVALRVPQVKEPAEERFWSQCRTGPVPSVT